MARAWSAAFALSLCVSPPLARAGSLKGTLVFPTTARADGGRPLAYWRVENGVLPIAAPPAEPRRDVVVVLEPERPPPPPPEGADPPQVTIDAKPLRLEPRVAVTPVGSVLQIKNGDRGARTLYLKDGESFMPRQPTAPGAVRQVKFTVAGEYQVCDADNARATTVLLIVGTPYFARSDDKGGFALDAPDGRYRLKAYYRGAWTSPQPVEVGRTREVAVKLPAAAAPDGEKK